jgi:hypothetical protein
MTAPTVSTLGARDAALLRGSLVIVWLATALASALEAQGQSVALLAQAGVRSPAAAAALLWAGIAFDLVVGLLLWRRPGRLALDAALLATLAMTVVTTALLPAMWLHPLGPLLKNLPIAAALVVLRRNTP